MGFSEEKEKFFFCKLVLCRYMVLSCASAGLIMRLTQPIFVITFKEFRRLS